MNFNKKKYLPPTNASTITKWINKGGDNKISEGLNENINGLIFTTYLTT